MVPIDHPAVLAAALLYIAAGYAWYGSLLGATWRHWSGLKEDPFCASSLARSWRKVLAQSVFALAAAYAIGYASIFAGAYLALPSAFLGPIVGLGIWFGIYLPGTVGNLLWERHPWRLYAVHAGFYFVAFVSMSVLLAFFA